MPFLVFGHPASLRLIRAASFSAGASGELVPLPWDLEDTLLPRSGLEHSPSAPEIITCLTSRLIGVCAAARFASALLLSEAHVELEHRRPPSPFARVALASVPGPVTVQVATHLGVESGDELRVRVAAVGLPGAAIVPGQGHTYLSIVG